MALPSIASTILAMVGGFQLLLQIALLLYAMAVIAIWRVPLALRAPPPD